MVILDRVLGHLCIARHTRQCPCTVVPEAMHEESRGPLKSAMSAQKALQGSDTETRELLGGMEENSVSPTDEGNCSLGNSINLLYGPQISI